MGGRRCSFIGDNHKWKRLKKRANTSHILPWTKELRKEGVSSHVGTASAGQARNQKGSGGAPGVRFGLSTESRKHEGFFQQERHDSG